MIADLVTETRARLAALRAARARRHPRRAGQATVGVLAGDGGATSRGCKAFLFERVYRHQRVMRVMRDAERIVGDLFAATWPSRQTMAEAWHAASRGLESAAARVSSPTSSPA